MMKITVFEWESVCHGDLSPDGLKRFGDVSFYGKPEPDEVASIVGDSEAVICSKVNFTRELIESLPRLRYIGLMATGYNNVDVEACREKGIVVTNVPDYSASAVTQMTLSFLLQFATNLIAYHDSVQKLEWTKSPLFCLCSHPMTELEGKTLGLVGLGSIGSRVACAATALGMRVIYHTRHKKDVPYEYVDRDTLFSESDFLSLHCPLTADTKMLICPESLSKMKRSVFIINTARGGLVDETAVAKALEDGLLAGYAADVLTVEPQSASCPLIGAKNCILTPHVAWAPKETRVRLWNILEENVAAFVRGKPQNTVQG